MFKFILLNTIAIDFKFIFISIALAETFLRNILVATSGAKSELRD